MIRMTGDVIAPRLAVLLITVLCLSACGGGASTDVASNGPGNTAPTSVPPCGIEGTGIQRQDCNGGTDQTGRPTNMNSLLPSCAPVGGQAFTLEVSGNFPPGSIVKWNGSALPTTVFNGSIGTQLDAEVPASDIAAAGTAVVTVVNPSGGISTTSTFTITAGGEGPMSVVVDPTGKFAYVANTGCPDSFVGDVSMYTINATTGILTAIAPPVNADFGAHSVAVDPVGKFVYVANDGDYETGGSVSSYTINVTTGALTLMGTIAAPCTLGPGSCSSSSVAVHPSGKFVYVANEGGYAPTSVSVYASDATTGALTLIETIASGGRAVSVAVDRSGKFAYVTDSGNTYPGEHNNVAMFSINATTGTLTSMGAIAAGTDPLSVAVDPTGKFAYVANSSSNDVSMYTIDATTGTLTSVGLTAAGTGPVSAAVDPTGKFVYVANNGSNNVSMYTIDASTGQLTSIGTIAAGLSPTSIAMSPSGKFVYVTNYGSNDVSMYNFDPASGFLVFVGTIGT